ncbi:ArnT family glycosyltransferase [Prochlorococcus marinus]|uniref:Glycosyltransferase RgtA/B/C/D-like domain-containing protein n=1 Tax=Prochlorococcus marinus (strain MIT 9303) TaxID=59922 RepID=A2CCW0_PROM3|nr:glycosyltransferase family 39 protein [Prochlorococcus marinus]ABM79320.1 Hypothetical protein P9303_25891 [Prochlorococcus marinus str. MIT 9303]
MKTGHLRLLSWLCVMNGKQVGRLFAGLAALWTTWPGISQGLGLIGEEATRVAIAAQIAGTGDLNPHWFGHPATLLNYMLAGLFQAFAFISGTIDIRHLYTLEPESLFLIGRLVSRFAAIFSAVLCFEVASKIMNLRWASVSAILLSLNPLFVIHAHRARADHVLTSALLIATLLLINILENKQKGAWRLAAFAGIALTFKYSAASILLSLIIALFYSKGSSRPFLIRLNFIIVVFIAAIFLSSPYLFLDWKSAFGGLYGEVSKQSIWQPHLSAIKFSKILLYSLSSLGLLSLAIYSISRLIIIAKTRARKLYYPLNKHSIAINALLLIYLPFIAGGFFASTYNSTWLSPALPFLSILLALSIKTFCKFMLADGNIVKKALGILFIFSIFIDQTMKMRGVHLMRQMKGSSVEAEEWLMKNVNPGESVLLLQPRETYEAAGFPRIFRTGADIFIIDDKNHHSQVCTLSPDEYLRKNPQSLLINLPCHPRPVFVSQSKTSISELLKKYDYIVTSMRVSLMDREKVKNSSSVIPVIEFFPPRGIVNLVYSLNPFPQGDSAVWSSIRIYKRNRSI